MAMIITGATPTHEFDVDTDLTQAVEIWISYSQNRKLILNKTMADGIEVTENQVSIKLTQEDTLLFDKIGEVKIQIRARFADGNAIVSDIIKTTASECLKKEVI